MVAAEIIACIDVGDCVVSTVTRYYIQIGIFVMAGIFLVLLLIMAFWTPAFIFMRAKMSKNPLIYIVNRGQGGRFAVGRAKSEGILDVRKTGPFIMTENSHTREHKSGLPLFFAFGEFAGTVPLKWVYAVNKIKKLFGKKGEEIKNVDDFGKKIGLKFDKETGKWT